MASRRDFLIIFCGRIASAFISIASLRITTSLLTPNDYGLFALLGTFQSFCGLFLINPVGQHINRHTHAWCDDGTLLKRLARYNRYIVGVALLISLPVMVWWYISQTKAIDGRLMIAMLAGVAVGSIVYLGTWNSTLVPMLNLLGYRARSVVWTITTTVVSIAFSVLFLMLYHSAVAWMLGQAVGAAIGAWFAWASLRRFHAKAPQHQSNFPAYLLDKQTIKTFCLPLAIATGFMWLQNAGYRFVVGGVWGAEELGILVIGLGISAQLWAIIESLAMQFLGPYLYRNITNSKSDVQSGQVLSDYINCLLPVYAAFAGFNAICGVAVLNVLTNVRYHAAVPFVVFGSLIEFARATTNLWSNAAQAKRRTVGVILPYSLGAAVVWLGAIGVTHFKAGLTGLSIVLVVAGIVTCGSMIIIMQRLLPIKINITRCVLGLSIIAGCFAIAIIAPLNFAGLYQNLIVLLTGGTITSLLFAAFLWRNTSLIRLISTTLRSN